MHCNLATLATLVAALIAQDRALGAPSPTDSNSPNNPQPPLNNEVSNTAPNPPFSAFPDYCPELITSGLRKKARAALDYIGLWRKKHDPKVEAVEEVADWLSVRLAAARMGYNYVDPTLKNGIPAIVIWVMPTSGLPVVDLVPHSEFRDDGSPVNDNRKGEHNKPVYIMLNRENFQQSAGKALVTIFRDCYGTTINRNPISTTSAKTESDRPAVGPNTSPPQADGGYSITTQYNSQSQHGDTTMNYFPADGRPSTFEMPSPNQPFVALRNAGVGEFSAPQDTSTAPPKVDPYHWNLAPNLQNSAPTAEKQQDLGDPTILLQPGNYPPENALTTRLAASPTGKDESTEDTSSVASRVDSGSHKKFNSQDFIEYSTIHDDEDALTTRLAASPAGKSESTEDTSSVASRVDSGSHKKFNSQDFIEYSTIHDDEDGEQAREPLNDSERKTESTRSSVVKPEPSSTTIPPPDVDETDSSSEYDQWLALSKHIQSLVNRTPANIQRYQSEISLATDWNTDTDNEDAHRQDAKGFQLSKKLKMD
ncbi:hypothetical protein IWQ60_005135 [Tieghemiomyces parasiticus]|uniref:Uncharacterized protein n=1 Tax=Tieghemiomyces parasiticus TaxID=78921 RepID=A0A9W8DUW8_9FUNG|nr:hypothetical protein IWQ60_005135 [Tieghemiomyces parasiticus]